MQFGVGDCKFVSFFPVKSATKLALNLILLHYRHIQIAVNYNNYIKITRHINQSTSLSKISRKTKQKKKSVIFSNTAYKLIYKKKKKKKNHKHNQQQEMVTRTFYNTNMNTYHISNNNNQLVPS